jgi:dihydroxyacetone kinase-like predicted kinase
LHVHTYEPEKILAYMHGFGELVQVKIENMNLGHSAAIMKKEEKGGKEQKERLGVVAVCQGKGIEELFLSLGADKTLCVRQTDNPSAKDFLKAFSVLDREHIFVFPNNGNVIMAAKMAGDMYKEAKVHVIPTRDVGEGYAALSVADFSEENVENLIHIMTEAAGRVLTGIVSPAVRDIKTGGINVRQGDAVAIVNKEIIAATKDNISASLSLASYLIDRCQRRMLTLFSGKGALLSEREIIKEKILNDYPGVELYTIDGGQDVYQYIFVAE